MLSLSPERSNLKFAIAVLALCFFSTLSFGQDACGQIGLPKCRPSTPAGPPPVSRPPQKQTDDTGDSGQRPTWRPLASKEIHDQQRAKTKAEVKDDNEIGNAARLRYVKSGSVADYNAAMAAYDASLKLSEMNEDAVIGLTSLLLLGGDHRHALEWLTAGLGLKDVKHDKPVYEWFKLAFEEETNEVDKLKYANQCGEVGTSASSNGGVVDPRADVMKYIRFCREWAARIKEADVRFIESEARYQSKYHNK